MALLEAAADAVDDARSVLLERGEQGVAAPDEDAGVPPRAVRTCQQLAGPVAVRLLDEALDAARAVGGGLVTRPDDVAVAGFGAACGNPQGNERAVICCARRCGQRVAETGFV